MRKLITITAAAFLLSAGIASAATVTSNAVFNGQTQFYGNAGQNAEATFQVHVNAGEVFHAIRTKVDSQATVCKEVGPFEGDQTVSIPVSIMLPPNSNTSGYSFVADLFTTDTLPQAQAMTGDLACSSAGSGAHVFAAAYNGGTVVNVLPANGSTGSSAPSSGSDQWLAILTGLQSILAKMSATSTATVTPAPTPVPTISAACSNFAQALVGTFQGVNNDANASLQGFLLSPLGGRQSIPALKSGAAFGFYGTQTANAVSMFKMQNSCQ